jgi:hypothetical protein
LDIGDVDMAFSTLRAIPNSVQFEAAHTCAAMGCRGRPQRQVW